MLDILVLFTIMLDAMGYILKNFVITDTHFLHRSIVTDFCFRPPDFENRICKNWSRIVSDSDVVFHLGDVTWGDKAHLKKILEHLPGTKILIRGNHDRCHSNSWFVSSGFSAVLEKAQVGKIILSHMPSEISEKEIENGIVNVHGHFHNAPPHKWEDYLRERITDNHRLLALEMCGYQPVDLSKILSKKITVNSKSLLKQIHY